MDKKDKIKKKNRKKRSIDLVVQKLTQIELKMSLKISGWLVLVLFVCFNCKISP